VSAAADSSGGVRRHPWLLWAALALSLTLNICFVGGLVWTKMTVPPVLTPQERLQHLTEQLNLTPEQRIAFEQFVRSVRMHGGLLRENNEPILQRVWAEYAKPTPDQALIDKLVQQANDNRHAFQREAAAALAAFMAELNPDQRATFSKLAQARQDQASKRLWQMIIH
jgi:Spy/CpxP family protein refolding chaperone